MPDGNLALIGVPGAISGETAAYEVRAREANRIDVDKHIATEVATGLEDFDLEASASATPSFHPMGEDAVKREHEQDDGLIEAMNFTVCIHRNLLVGIAPVVEELTTLAVVELVYHTDILFVNIHIIDD